MVKKNFNKLKLCFVMCFFATFSLFFTGCLSTGGSGENNPIDSDSVVRINNLVATSVGDGGETYADVEQFVSGLSNKILNGLVAQYGASSLIARSSADTHNLAYKQDSWTWDFANYTTTQMSPLLQYQIYNVLLGNEIKSILPSEISSVSKELTSDNLTSLAKKVSHTGFFYYEIDSIAEFVLNYVIGSDVVARDNYKFFDANGNGTFDYVENLGTVLVPYHNIISSYTLSYSRAENVSRNDIWNSIKWGNNGTSPTEIPSGVQDEKALPLTSTNGEASVESNITLYLSSLGLSLTSEQIQSEKEKFKQAGTNTYSGFKNYVNITYYILYTAMENFTISTNGLGEVIPNVLEMDHKPNITKTIIDPKNPSDDMPLLNYKSVLITAKEDDIRSTYSIAFFSTMTQTLKLNIKIRYHFTKDDYKQYFGAYTKESKIVEGEVGTMEISPKKQENMTFSLAINPSSINELNSELGKKEYTLDDCIPFTKSGVYNIVLGKYVNYTLGEGETLKFWQIKEGYVASHSSNFLGSNYNFVNDQADFMEFIFEPVGSYSEEIKYAFAFAWY